MKKEILQELKKIELKKDITILYAVESGSRSWGFHSLDSDWDVRFIYSHNIDWHLSLDNKKNSFDIILDNNIDLSGWELKKTLRLFRKSNPALLEWLTGPIIYIEKYSTVSRLRKLIPEYLNQKTLMYHYLHLALGYYKDYLRSDMVENKKYFYAFRCLFACSWLKENKTVPPVKFIDLMEHQLEDKGIKNIILQILEKKMSGEELGLEPKNIILNDYIQDKLNYYHDFLKNYEFELIPNTEKLETILKETLIEIYRE